MSVRADLAARVLLTFVAAYVALLICGLYFGVGGVAHHHVEAGWFWLLAGLVLYIYASGAKDAQHTAHVDGLALRWWTVLGMLAASGLLYAPSLFIGFLSDDYVLADRAIDGRFWNLITTELFRPASLLLWRGIFEVVGQDPTVVHLVNVVLHGLNAILVVAIASRVTNDGVLAFCTGLLFLTLPSNVEAVAWGRVRDWCASDRTVRQRDGSRHPCAGIARAGPSSQAATNGTGGNWRGSVPSVWALAADSGNSAVGVHGCSVPVFPEGISHSPVGNPRRALEWSDA